MKWEKDGSPHWDNWHERISEEHLIYACRRPDNYSGGGYGTIWGHVYVMKGAVADMNIVQHFQFNEFAPLEMECAMIAMREKYNTT